MDINWTTFTAQIINFLVLVWLLKRFLYGPIVRAMDEREQRLIARMDEASAAQHTAEQEAAEFQRKNNELDHAREELLAAAGREIEDWKQQHLQQAREEVNHARHEWYQAIQRERSTFLRDLRQRAAQQVHKLARTVMGKLCDTSLEEQVIEAFVERLRQLDPPQREKITQAIRNSKNKVIVETAFELPQTGQDRVIAVLHECLNDQLDCEFKVAPQLICGIELNAVGYKVAWSVGESLEELEDEFVAALDAVAKI